LGFGVWVSWFGEWGVWFENLCLGIEVLRLRFCGVGVWGLGFWVLELRFKVFGVGAQGLRFGV